MKRITNLLILCFISTVGTAQQDTLVLSLGLCRQMAVENNEVMLIADETIKKAEYTKKAARSAYLPNVKASAIGLYSQQDIEQELYLPTQVFDPTTGQLAPNVVVDPTTGAPVIGADGNPVFNTYAYMPLDISTRGGFMAGVSAEQPLYAGGKIVAGNKKATIGTTMAADNKKLKRVQCLYESDQAYYLYMATQEKVRLAKKYQELLHQLYTMVNDSYEIGMVNRNEVLKVKVQLNEVALQVQKAESGLELSRMSLCRVLGVPFSTPLLVEDSLAIKSLDMSATDVSHRIEYQMLDNQVQMAHQDVKMVQGDYLPTAGVSVGYNYYNIDLEDRDNYDHSGLSVMAKIEIPITTFGERKGKVNAQKSELAIKQLELQRVSELLTLEIEQARLNFVDARLRVEMSAEALEQADENLRVTQDSYELGLETIVNLLEAQAVWQEAYSQQIDAKTDCQLKASHYLRVTNKL